MVSINYVYGHVEKIIPSSVFIKDEETGDIKELMLTGEDDRKAVEALSALKTPLYFGYIGNTLACICEQDNGNPYLM